VRVINEGGTANRWPYEVRPESRVGPSDVEQNVFPGVALGVDHVDMQVAIAPRPLLCLIEDYSPRFNQAAEQIRLRYQQLGAVDRFATEEATDPHAWTPKLRLATTRWFSRWFYGKPGPDVEPEFEIEPAERLYCTQGVYSQGEEGRNDLHVDREEGGRAASFRSRSLVKLRELLRLPSYQGDLAVRTQVTTERKGYRIEKLEFISEPGVYIPTWVFVPPKPDPSGRHYCTSTNPARRRTAASSGGWRSWSARAKWLYRWTCAGSVARHRTVSRATGAMRTRTCSMSRQP
jgi:hypothetical protein